MRLQNGSLAVFSPQALTAEWKEHITSQGNRLNYIAVLDTEHHISLGEWAKAYPAAKVIGMKGLAESRRKGKKEEVQIHHTVEESNNGTLSVDPDFDAEFYHEFVHTHPNKELVFFYKPEKTLIQADLIFNLPATEQFSKSGEDPTTGFATKLALMLQGSAGEAMGQRRFLWHIASRADRPAFAKSMQRINAWGPERIIPCHGDVIETGGVALFQKLMAWHLNPKSK